MKVANKQVNISQSLMKRAWDYLYSDGCGIQLRDVDILKEYEMIPSPPMRLGQYFEYKATGQCLRDGSIPEMPSTVKGLPTADAKRADAQSENFKKMMADKKFEIIDTGSVITHGDLKIVTDALIKTPVHKVAILDTKFTGLLGDKWNEIGWDMEKYRYRSKLTIQPIFYKYVYEKNTGVKDVPFYYSIHSSKNDTDYDVWEVNLVNYDLIMEELEAEIKVIKALVSDIDQLIPNPSVKKCAKCPAFKDCVFKLTVPLIEDVNIFHLRENYENRKA